MGLPSCWVILLNISLFHLPFFLSLLPPPYSRLHHHLSAYCTLLTSLPAFAFAPVQLREVMVTLKHTLPLITLTLKTPQWYPLHSSYSSVFRTL